MKAIILLGKNSSARERLGFHLFFRLKLWLLVVALLAPASLRAQFDYITNNEGIAITGYAGPGGDVVIPDTIDGLPVRSIEDEAFFASTNLTSVTIPDSVNRIGSAAFASCSSLANIALGNGVTNIGSFAFASCTSLTNLAIPASVAEIGEGVAFRSSSLAAVTVDALNAFYCSTNGVLFDKSISALIAYPIGQTGDYLIPDSVARIGSFAFAYAGVTKIAISDTVINIGDSAFTGCAGLTNVTFGTNLLVIGDFAFEFCSSLIEVTIPDSVATIGTAAFYSCGSLTNAIVGDGVTSIGNYAFAFAGLNNITFGNGLTTIGDWGFERCTGLTNFVLPESLASIGVSAFSWCSGLTGVAIPAGVTNIGVAAFRFSINLTAIDVSSNNLFYSSLDGVLFNKNGTILIEYPLGKVGDSYSAPDSTTEIGQSALNFCFLTSVTLGNNVTNIADSAFANCPNLTGIYFQGNAPAADPSAFTSDDGAIVYYLPGRLGWGPTFGGCPAAFWRLPYPLILSDDPDFGISTNGFGFLISWATNTSIVVDSCTNVADPTWIPVSTNALISGAFHFSDPAWTNYPVRYYRLRQP